MWWGGFRKCREYIRRTWRLVLEFGESCEDVECVAGDGGSGGVVGGRVLGFGVGDLEIIFYFELFNLFSRFLS